MKTIKKNIKKILKEDFDWITNIPSFIEIEEPVSTKNPKEVYRLHFLNEHRSGYREDNWHQFKKTETDKLVRYIKILDLVGTGEIDTYELADIYIDKGYDWILTPWIKSQITGLDEDEIRETLRDFLFEDLQDIGIIGWDFNENDYTTLEGWHVTYFDEYGIEYFTKINF